MQINKHIYLTAFAFICHMLTCSTINAFKGHYNGKLVLASTPSYELVGRFCYDVDVQDVMAQAKSLFASIQITAVQYTL